MQGYPFAKLSTTLAPHRTVAAHQYTPHYKHQPPDSNGKESDNLYFISPCKGDKPHGARAEGKKYKYQQRRGRTCIFIHLLKHQVIAWGAAQTDKEGDHCHGKCQTPRSRENLQQHDNSTAQNTTKTQGYYSSGADVAQQTGAQQRTTHKGDGVDGKEIAKMVCGDT